MTSSAHVCSAFPINAKQQCRDGQEEDLEEDDENKKMEKAKELKEVQPMLDKARYTYPIPTPPHEQDDFVDYSLSLRIRGHCYSGWHAPRTPVCERSLWALQLRGILSQSRAGAVDMWYQIHRQALRNVISMAFILAISGFFVTSLFRHGSDNRSFFLGRPLLTGTPHVLSLGVCHPQDGNKLFAAREFRRAAELYTKALKQASKMSNCTDDYQSELPAVRVKLHQNLATVRECVPNWCKSVLFCTALASKTVARHTLEAREAGN